MKNTCRSGTFLSNIVWQKCEDRTHPLFSTSIFSLSFLWRCNRRRKRNKIIANATSVSSSLFKVFFSLNLMSLCRWSHYRHKRLRRYVILSLCRYVVMSLVWTRLNTSLVFVKRQVRSSISPKTYAKPGLRLRKFSHLSRHHHGNPLLAFFSHSFRKLTL
jgi:uncharacterized membrane protein